MDDVTPRRTWLEPLVCGVVAAVVRGGLAAAQWDANPLLHDPVLDSAAYLEWAGRIASGDLLAASSIGTEGPHGPYLLNPLYAWLIAPIVGLGGGVPGVLTLQALLGGATAGATAVAARRIAGSRAAWIAGLLVAFSTSLVHLSTNVSVATTAAALIALALVPGTSEDGSRGTSLRAGLWLGLGALARPITLLALPFVAWARGLRGGRAAAALVLVMFGAFAGASFARNLIVAGEPVVFTAANGLNLHLGNNRLARRLGEMFSADFHFAPDTMHPGAKHRVAFALGREPTSTEISNWYRERTLDEWREHPVESVLYTLEKARWFTTAEEPASSADLRHDRSRVPWLHVAFVPTWLLVAAGAAGLWLVRRERALLLTAGGLIVAHWASCTLVFPLSHYRAPVVPALALVAGVGVMRWRAAPRRDRIVSAVLVAAVAVAAWVPPRPMSTRVTFEHNRAVENLRAGRWVEAEVHASRVVALLPSWPQAELDLAMALACAGAQAEALPWAESVVEKQPWSVPAQLHLGEILLDLERADEALASMDALVERLPWSAEVRGARGRIRAFAGDLDGARADLDWAMERGHDPVDETRRKVGLPLRSPR